MRLPRSTPFAQSRQKELFSVYSHFYPSSPFLPSYPESHDRSHALSLVSLWMNRSTCPYAVESTASLIQASLLDSHISHLPSAELGIRMTYTLAITRFVNSFVDYYQNGMFAQSIASIAARIEMPLWFVDLRHAGTHQELPSLQVCREAGETALDWLHGNFWVPSLFSQPAEDPDEQQQVEVQEDNTKALQILQELLKEYRKLGKAVARDHSLAGRHKADIIKLCSKVQNWTNLRIAATQGSAKQIAARMGRKRTREEMEDQQLDEEGKVAMRELVGELIKPGGMVPLSKSKRSMCLKLSEELETTWSPLLDFIKRNLGTAFTLTLFEEMVSAMAGVEIEVSYKLTCESWVRALVSSADEAVEMALVSTCLRYPCDRTASLLRFLCDRNNRLAERVEPLLKLLENNINLVVADLNGSENVVPEQTKTGYEQDIKTMEERLQLFKEWSGGREAQHVQMERRERQLPEGWSYAGPEWKPTPIGCQGGIVPDLGLVL